MGRVFRERRLLRAAAAGRAQADRDGAQEGHEGQARTAGPSVLRSRRYARRRRAGGRGGAARAVAEHRSRVARLRAARTRGAQTHAARRVIQRPALEPVSRADEARMARRCIARALSGGPDRRVPGHRSIAVRDLRSRVRAGRAALSRRRPEAGDLQLPRRRPAYVSHGARVGVGALYARGQPAFDGADHRCLQPRLQRESGGLHPGRTRLSAGARRHQTARAVHRQHARCGVFRYRRLLRVDVAAWRIGALEVGRAAGRGRSMRRRNRAAAARCAER